MLFRSLLDHPHYTRLENIAKIRAPEILLSGNHALIERWRLKQALGRTFLHRPDIFCQLDLSDAQQKLLNEFRCATHRLQCRVRRAGSRQEGRVVPGRLGHGLLGARTRPGAQQAIDARRRAQRSFRQHRGLQPQVLNDRSGDDSAAQGPGGFG